MAPAAALLLAAATALAGCAQQVRVNGSWQDDAARDQAYTRVLVVAVSPDVNQRCAFEQFLVVQIQGETTQAIASCRALSLKDPLTVENVERAIETHRIDAVIATSLIASKIGAQEGGSRETRGDAYFKPTDIGYWTGYYGAYGMPVVYGEFQTAPSITTVQGEVEILTKVFDTRDAALVYELNTKARDLESRESGLAIVTGPIADRLRKDGLVR
jgi:hypothetical protein